MPSMTSKNSSIRTPLASLLMALSTGCSHAAEPKEPRVVTVTQRCITAKEPSEETLIDCLDQGNRDADCLTVENNELRKWIRTQIAKCGAK